MTSTDFREPWRRAEDDSVGTFEDEAAAEIADGHELYGLALTAIAKCEGCDSVVYRASDGTFAIVLLSWTHQRETPPWPRTTRLGGFIALESAMDQHGH